MCPAQSIICGAMTPWLPQVDGVPQGAVTFALQAWLSVESKFGPREVSPQE